MSRIRRHIQIVRDTTLWVDLQLPEVTKERHLPLVDFVDVRATIDTFR
jgi:hypothetical protein